MVASVFGPYSRQLSYLYDYLHILDHLSDSALIFFMSTALYFSGLDHTALGLAWMNYPCYHLEQIENTTDKIADPEDSIKGTRQYKAPSLQTSPIITKDIDSREWVFLEG